MHIYFQTGNVGSKHEGKKKRKHGLLTMDTIIIITNYIAICFFLIFCYTTNIMNEYTLFLKSVPEEHTRLPMCLRRLDMGE